MKVSAVLRKTQNGFAHWCPACKQLHIFTTEGRNHCGAAWGFDGNVEAPTFTPSMHCSWGGTKDPDDGTEIPREVCHYFLHGGMIQFLGDCTHAMAGMTVPLPPLPPEWGS